MTTNRISRRSAIKTAAGAAGASLFGLDACRRSAHAQSLEVLKIGVPPFVNQSAIFLAQDMGWFRKVGIDLRLQIFPDGSLIVAPLVSGEIDLGVVTCSAGLFNSLSRGAPFRALLCNGQGRAGRSGLAILVSPELYDQGVKKIADLAKIKGKTVAVPAAGSINQYGMARAIQEAKLNPVSDVNWQTTMSMPDTLKQMGQKQIEIAGISYQLGFFAQRQNIGRMIASGDEIVPDAQTTMTAVRDSVLAARRDLIVRFAMAYIHAGRLFNKAAGDPGSHPDVLQIITKYIIVKDVEILKAIAPHWEWISENGAPNADSVMAQQEFWSGTFKMIERKVARERVLDLSVSAEATARLEREKPFDI